MNSIICPNCGICFGIPAHWEAARREDKKTFYCPNGHAQSFTESTADKLRRERDRLAQQIAQRDDEIARQRRYREEAERRHIAAKGQITKLKKRAANGVCPCCTRSFVNLQQHMATKHPGFVSEPAAGDEKVMQ